MNSRTHIIGTIFAVGGAGLFLLDCVVTVLAFAPVIPFLSNHRLTDPAMAAEVLGEMVVTLAARSINAFPGLLLLTLALVTLRYRARWFFWFVMVAGVLALFLIPVGTAFGIFFLWYGWRHRREFGTRTNIGRVRG